MKKDAGGVDDAAHPKLVEPSEVQGEVLTDGLDPRFREILASTPRLQERPGMDEYPLAAVHLHESEFVGHLQQAVNAR